jgi:hypothetical protein
MSALGRFFITANGGKIMTSALFVSLTIAGSIMDQTAAVASPITPQTSMSQILADQALKTQVAETDQAVEVFHARLVERQQIAHRYQEALGVLACTVSNIEGIFALSHAELSARDKITTARRIIANNLAIARPMVVGKKDGTDAPASYGTTDAPIIVANPGRQDLVHDLQTYREQVDYLTDELDRAMTEVKYYHDEFAKAVNALDGIMKVKPEDAASIKLALAAFRDAKSWQTEFLEEMASTGEDALIMAGSR